MTANEHLAISEAFARLKRQCLDLHTTHVHIRVLDELERSHRDHAARIRAEMAERVARDAERKGV